ncbi:hypothetical protein F4677DRAFT_319258 [Hypoxylon crocopeplum]|nr:hypothetical protein F4677DRAFT_319258 [Hypoxylon crocopeplum]
MSDYSRFRPGTDNIGFVPDTMASGAYGMEHAPQATGVRGQYQPYDEEEEWKMDETQEQMRAHRHRSYGQQYQQHLEAAMIGNVGSSQPVAQGRLPYPVILPQRRPKQRDRGFIRAYAPDLMRCGIDEPTFMAFLDGFDKATADAPLLGVVNLAGGAAGLIPSVIAPPIGLGVQVAAGIYKEIQGRKNQNAYISKMNEALFKPRGLYCLIMAYSSNSDKTFEEHDLNGHVNGQGGSRGKFRANDGMMGPIEFPASAELIFPELEDDSSDEEQQEGDGGGVKGALSKAFENFKDHRDLKAQRKYLRKNPLGALNSLMDPKVELTAKDRGKQERRLEKDERKRGKEERKREKKARKHPDRVQEGPRKRKIRQDILYLMIVNMPPREEMENAMRIVGGQGR